MDFNEKTIEVLLDIIETFNKAVAKTQSMQIKNILKERRQYYLDKLKKYKS